MRRTAVISFAAGASLAAALSFVGISSANTTRFYSAIAAVGGVGYSINGSGYLSGTIGRSVYIPTVNGDFTWGTMPQVTVQGTAGGVSGCTTLDTTSAQACVSLMNGNGGSCGTTASTTTLNASYTLYPGTGSLTTFTADPAYVIVTFADVSGGSCSPTTHPNLLNGIEMSGS